MTNQFSSDSLPITVTEDGLSFDATFLTVLQETSFKTRMLRRFYLNSVTVYPKVVYKTYWLDDAYNTFARLGIKVKATIIFSDIVGIEFAKTKTITSVDKVRIIECISGIGVAIVQPKPMSLAEEMIPQIVDLISGTKVIVPPGWSYTLVNTGKESLATIEILHKDQEIHQMYVEKRGAPLYLIERNGTVEIVKNSQYKNVQKYVKLNSDEYSKSLDIKDTPTIVHQICVDGKCFTWFDQASNQNWEDTLAATIIGDPFSFNG